MFRPKRGIRSKSVEQTKPGTKAATNGRKGGGNFVMEDDDNGDMTASSTSDSEVVVVVSDVRRSNVDKKRVDKKKVEKGRLKVRNEEERVRTLVSVFFNIGRRPLFWSEEDQNNYQSF